MAVHQVLIVEVVNAIENGAECIDQFIFSKKLLIEGPFAVLQFNHHVGLSLWVQQAVSVKERPEQIGVGELLQKGFWIFYLEIVICLFRISVYQQNVPLLKFRQHILFRCCFLEISHRDLFSLIYFLLILIKLNVNLHL